MTFMDTTRFQEYLQRVAENTHCRNGHPFTAENTRLQVRKRANGQQYLVRTCRACQRERQRARRSQRRQARKEAA